MNIFDRFANKINNATEISQVMSILDSAYKCDWLTKKDLEHLYFLGNDKVQNLVQ